VKKLFFVGNFLVLVLFSTYAQGFYFDIGLGIGKAWTKWNGTDVADVAELRNFVGPDFMEGAVDIGLKAGYGPVANIPLYIAGTFGGIGHRFDNDTDFSQFNAYSIGPSVIFYPISLIQLAGSLGYSFVVNQTPRSMNMPRHSKGGVAGDVSVAVDLGRRNHGCLIGVKYFGAVNTLRSSAGEQNASELCVFVRYTYRQKISK
jgi:hypothetical protein